MSVCVWGGIEEQQQGKGSLLSLSPAHFEASNEWRAWIFRLKWVGTAFYSGWISRFGPPLRLTTDQGTQFESALFQALTKFLGTARQRTSYHPAANGKVERFHRQLKAVIMAHGKVQWSSALPTILLGFRATRKEDLEATTAEMVYGAPIRLPGEFLSPTADSPDPSTFVGKLKEVMQRLLPHKTQHHGQRSVFVSKDLSSCSHVFLRTDALRKGLQSPYEGPFQVLDRHEKLFKINKNGKELTVNIDRVKPAYVLRDCDSTRLPASEPPTPQENLQEDRTARTSRPETVTRSGRRVRFNPRGFERRPIARRTYESIRNCRPMQKDPEAVLLIEGNRLFLTCTICLPPSAPSRGVWKRLLPDAATFVPVQLDGRRSRLLEDLSLEVINIREKDSGIYYCFQGLTVFAKYAVDVVQEEPHNYIILSGKKKSRSPTENIPLKDNNLMVFLKWSEWSECNRCNSVGRRRRVGICMVKKIDTVSPTKPVDTQILKEYRYGIPCRSGLLPKAIRELSTIQTAKSEFMIGFCKIPCPRSASIVVITDKTGAVVDTVDNSQGFYSMHQPLPDLPALAKRTTIYEEEGSSIIMSCPGNTEGKFLTWRNDSYVINPSKVHVLTKGRVKIDIGNNLHIRKLRFSDASVYSCWDDKTLVGTTRLVVLEKSMERNYRFHVLNIGILFTFITVFMIACTICRNTKLKANG
ncbi:hypothetical protein AVEN_117489-1 [Araneus ventricosus]|uniref:Integrase catalytic domain-containing protein n=1 Tax=Araneus ventricosus TaxID=182803 RepID=A0A4Y2JTW6_ARAVE|nr:hypothetical protein AVEN_117489-1 [Araneus ventricosus]